MEAESLDKPVLAILRNVRWEPAAQSESTYVYADEVPVLRQGLSIVLDIWSKHDWMKIAKIIDFVVDEIGGERELINARTGELIRE